LEGQLFQIAGPAKGLVQFHAHGRVRVSGMQDTTENIRRGYIVEGKSIDLTDTRHEENDYDAWLSTSERSSNLPHADKWPKRSVNIHQPNLSAFSNRTHYRVVTEDMGWPLTDFVSLSELLLVLTDVVKGLFRSKLRLRATTD
jgi:hypothetical protein